VIEAKKNGVVFITEKTLFLSEINNISGLPENKRPKIIAISGTKGKTTTSTFCAYLLENMGYKVLLGVNMGIPTIKLNKEAKKTDFVVLEMSSYQTSDLMTNVDVGIILNLFPEHIDWHGTHDIYYNDKMNLLRWAIYPIINGNDERILKLVKDKNKFIEFGTQNTLHYKDGYFYDKNTKLVSSENMKLLGEHNYRNLCSVLTALKVLNVDFSKIKQEYFDNFNPVEHRLELIKKDGILFVNDSISTIPENTIACYKVFKDKNIYSILGGFDREQDYSELVNYIINDKNIKFLALLGQTGVRLSKMLQDKGFGNVELCNSLEKCVEVLKAKIDENGSENSVMILSPAAPSYDMFKNFEERGRRFKELVNS
jgi:UDP-N-acetylmuramoylalanine--D-glutamate ligase